MKRLSLSFISFALFLFLFSPSSAFAEPATKEDIRLLRQELKEDIKALREEMRVLNEQTNKRIDDTNRSIDDLRDTMFWLFGTFIGIALILIGFVIRNLWVLGGKVRGI